MNNKERIDNPLMKKSSDNQVTTDKKGNPLVTIKNIKTETGVMKGNVFNIHDPESFKKLQKNLSEGIIDFGWYQNTAKVICTC